MRHLDPADRICLINECLKKAFFIESPEDYEEISKMEMLRREHPNASDDEINAARQRQIDAFNKLSPEAKELSKVRYGDPNDSQYWESKTKIKRVDPNKDLVGTSTLSSSGAAGRFVGTTPDTIYISNDLSPDEDYDAKHHEWKHRDAFRTALKDRETLKRSTEDMGLPYSARESERGAEQGAIIRKHRRDTESLSRIPSIRDVIDKNWRSEYERYLPGFDENDPIEREINTKYLPSYIARKNQSDSGERTA